MFKPISIRRVAALLLTGLILGGSAPEEAGRFRLRNAGHAESELVLDVHGRFRWTFIGDQMDERASGRWRRSGTAVLLTTDPPASAFELVREMAYLNGAWALQVEVEQEGVPVPGATLEVGFAQGAPTHGVTGDDGWRLPRRERRRPLWLRIALPAYRIRTSRLPIYTREANSLRFQLQPVAAGTVNFRDEPVVRRGQALVLHYAGGELIYERTNETE